VSSGPFRSERRVEALHNFAQFERLAPWMTKKSISYCEAVRDLQVLQMSGLMSLVCCCRGLAADRKRYNDFVAQRLTIIRIQSPLMMRVLEDPVLLAVKTIKLSDAARTVKRLQARWPEFQHTRLHKAAQRGLTDRVKELLTLGLEPDPLDVEGHSPLTYAACIGRVDVVALLLDTSGVQINRTNTHGQSVLYVAAERGQPAVVQKLLAKELDVNATDTHRGETALVAAARSRKFDVVRLLLADERTDPKIAAKDQSTALMHLAEAGETELATQCMHRMGGSVHTRDELGGTALLKAAIAGHSAIVTALLAAQGAPLNQGYRKEQTTPLIAAVENDRLPVVQQLLLDKGCNINAQVAGRTALLAAVIHDRLTIARYLLEQGADHRISDDWGHSPLATAKNLRHHRMAALLREHGAVDSPACTIL
jgi:uncharacterized protein